jgi:hypothetical protein
VGSQLDIGIGTDCEILPPFSARKQLFFVEKTVDL